MREDIRRSVSCVAVVSLTAVFAHLLESETQAHSIFLPVEVLGQDRVILRGIVRDFRSDHPDFAIVPPEGFGHTPANVSLTLSSALKPVFVGQGFKAATQWRTVMGRPIAPHMYNRVGWEYYTWDNAGVSVDSSMVLQSNATIDSWDSSQGNYTDTQGTDGFLALNSNDITLENGADIGATVFTGPDSDPSLLSLGNQVTGYAGTLETEGTMPIVIVPNLGASIGSVFVANGMTRVINSSFLCDNFELDNLAIADIDGDVSIVCSGILTLRNNSQINLRPGARLRIYTLGDVVISYNVAEVNTNTMDPSLVTWYHMSTSPFNIQNNSKIVATIVAPNAELQIMNNGHLYGNFKGKSLWMGNNGELHIDTAGGALPMVCGTLVDDTKGTMGVFSRGAVDSRYTFGQWFRNKAGVNAGKAYQLSLNLAADGMYEFMTADFHPIDDDLYGNEGASHNWYFTLEIPATFTYEACTGQVLMFQGDDDAWMFVDGKMVMDLGGMIANVPQVVEMDRLGLTDGQSYDVRFFYAQRQGTMARFGMRTNIDLIPDPYTLGYAGFPAFD